MATTKTKKPKTTTFKKHTLITNMSSAEYHATPGTYSSSQLKSAVANAEPFVNKYIKGTAKKEESDAFDLGTYYHTAVLEPDKLSTECVVFPGKTRYGEKWTAFKAKHAGKAIVTEKQLESAEGIVEATKASSVAMGLIERGRAEVSLFVDITVYKGEIFAPFYNKILTDKGWADATPTKLVFGGKGSKTVPAEEFVIKVRADSLGDTFVLDLKSTTGDAKDDGAMSEKVRYYQYDLSAALYVDLFSLVNPDIADFYWVFASKEFLNVQTYSAGDNLLIGRKKWATALKNIAASKRRNWEPTDTLRVLEPCFSERRYLKQDDTDLV